MLQNWRNNLFTPVDIYSLVFVRITFGLVLFIEIAKLFYFGQVRSRYIEPEFYFKYYGFTWVKDLPDYLVNPFFIILGILAIFIAIGAFYRISVALFFFGFSYIFLLDQALYLNHYYMVILFTFLLCFLPANRYFSIDSSYINPKIKSKAIPYWCISLLKIQAEIILIYAGIVKINSDWLNFYPLEIWFPAYGSFFAHHWFIAAGAYGSILLHIIGAPLLFFKKSRIWIFLVYVVFHCCNFYMFAAGIGIFPWMTIAITTIFFEAHWPVQFWHFIKNIKNFKSFSKINEIYKKSSNIKSTVPKSKDFKLSKNRKNLIIIFILIWTIFHSLFPLRRFIYEGNSSWHGMGRYFSWRLKLNHFQGMLYFHIVDNKENRLVRYSREDKRSLLLPDEMRHLTLKQFNDMGSKPFMIMQYAHYLKKIWSERVGHDDISIYATSICSLNGRKPQYLIDQNVDLTQESESFSKPEWIVPLDPNSKAGEMPLSDFNKEVFLLNPRPQY